MRNAMICVSMMLAVFLVWPLVFGANGAKGLETAAEARAIVPIPQPRAVQVAFAPEADAKPKAESCYKRYQREVKQCTGTSGAACRLGAADHWDMCEATGFWPE